MVLCSVHGLPEVLWAPCPFPQLHVGESGPAGAPPWAQPTPWRAVGKGPQVAELRDVSTSHRPCPCIPELRLTGPPRSFCLGFLTTPCGDLGCSGPQPACLGRPVCLLPAQPWHSLGMGQCVSPGLCPPDFKGHQQLDSLLGLPDSLPEPGPVNGSAVVIYKTTWVSSAGDPVTMNEANRPLPGFAPTYRCSALELPRAPSAEHRRSQPCLGVGRTQCTTHTAVSSMHI